MQPYRAGFRGTGVVLVGVTQERAMGWTATKTRQGRWVRFAFHRKAVCVTGLGKRGSTGGEQPPPDASVPYYPCGMKQPEEFSEYYADLLEGRYDCVDRIVLTGYFPLGQQGGGFRYWWRKLTGSDESLDQAHLLHMAGRFSRTFDTLGVAA